MLPIFVNCRDRVRDLRKLVAWLERAGQERIILLDNDSTYEPLLDYYKQTPHEVVHLNENLGSHSLWRRPGLLPDGWFAFTDPDIVPIEECPLDTVEHLRELVEQHQVPKAGLGLYLDDVPADMPGQGIERALVAPHREVAPGVFYAPVDTTFAVYGPMQGDVFPYLAVRTGFPYQARHMGGWYKTFDDEDRYYLGRARAGEEGSSWKQWPELFKEKADGWLC